MITRIRIEGESDSSETLHGEFQWLANRMEEAFKSAGVATLPGHVLMERCPGDPDVSVHGNWKGRSTIHFDTQKLNEQLAARAQDGPELERAELRS